MRPDGRSVTPMRVLITAVALLAVAGIVGSTPGVAAGMDEESSESSDSTITTLQVAQSRLERGNPVVVEGTGWMPNTMVQVELCGQEAREGSADCDVRSSRSVATFADGRLRAELNVTAPPSPCPCVVRAFIAMTAMEARVPVQIHGHPFEEPTEEVTIPVRRIDVDSIEVSTAGTGLWSRDREVRITLRNSGDVTMSDVVPRARWGRGDSARRLITMSAIERLEPGATAVSTGRFHLDRFTFGRFDVRADIPSTEGAGAEADTSAPIFELLLVILGVLLVIAAVVGLLRRRSHGDEPRSGGGPEPSDDGTGDAVDGEPGADEPTGEADGDPVDADAGSSPSEQAGKKTDSTVRSARPPRIAPATGFGPVSGPFPNTGPTRRGGWRWGTRGGPARAFAGLLTAVALLVPAACTGGGDDRALRSGEICRILEAADPGETIGGESLVDQVEGIMALAEIDPDRVPEPLDEAVRDLRGALDASADARLLPKLEPGDDGFTEAHRAAYRLRFAPGVREAAAIAERYGVDECDLVWSGNLELPPGRSDDPIDPSVALPDDVFEDLTVEFPEEDFADFRLSELEIPEVVIEVDRGGSSFQPSPPRAPDLSGQERSVPARP